MLRSFVPPTSPPHQRPCAGHHPDARAAETTPRRTSPPARTYRGQQHGHLRLPKCRLGHVGLPQNNWYSPVPVHDNMPPCGEWRVRWAATWLPTRSSLQRTAITRTTPFPANSGLYRGLFVAFAPPSPNCPAAGTARQRGVVTQPHTPPHGHSHMHTIVVGTKRIDRASRFQGETQMLTPLFLRFFRNDPELVHVAATPTHMFINIRIGTWQAPRAPRPSTSTYSCNRCSNSSRRPSHRLPAARSTHCSVSRGMSLKSTPNQCDRVFRRPGH